MKHDEGKLVMKWDLENRKAMAETPSRKLYKLTLEAQKRLEDSPLSRREIIRRLGTSPAQFYRLIDQTNYRKSIDKLLLLLNVLDCEVELVVHAKGA
jgi:predicted XRE-type DNA-binding protein